jgi:hypothetical protein
MRSFAFLAAPAHRIPLARSTISNGAVAVLLQVAPKFFFAKPLVIKKRMVAKSVRFVHTLWLEAFPQPIVDCERHAENDHRPL